MAKERIQARVDDTRKREVEAYADEHDITQAEAVRRLVGRGIDYEQGRLKPSETDEPGAWGRASQRFGSLAYEASIITIAVGLATMVLQLLGQGGAATFAWAFSLAAASVSVVAFVVALVCAWRAGGTKADVVAMRAPEAAPRGGD